MITEDTVHFEKSQSKQDKLPQTARGPGRRRDHQRPRAALLRHPLPPRRCCSPTQRTPTTARGPGRRRDHQRPRAALLRPPLPPRRCCSSTQRTPTTAEGPGCRRLHQRPRAALTPPRLPPNDAAPQTKTHNEHYHHHHHHRPSTRFIIIIKGAVHSHHSDIRPCPGSLHLRFGWAGGMILLLHTHAEVRMALESAALSIADAPITMVRLSTPAWSSRPPSHCTPRLCAEKECSNARDPTEMTTGHDLHNPTICWIGRLPASVASVCDT